MKINEKQLRWKFIFETIGIIFILIGVFFASLFAIMGFQNTYACHVWNDDWTIQVDGSTYEHQAIDTFSMHEIKPGKKVILTNIIPSDTETKQLSIAFYTYQSTVEAYINDSSIYEYGMDYYESNDLVPTNLNIIDLGQEYGGKELRIEIMATITYSYRYIEQIYMGPTVEIFSYILKTKFISVFSSFFIISVSIISIGLALTLYGKKMSGRNTFSIGAFLLMLGTWIACNSRIILLFNKNELFDTYLEYIVFFLMTIPLLMYFWKYAKDDKKDKNIWIVLLGVNILLFFIATVLSLNHLFYYPEFLPIFHTFDGLLVFYILYLIIKRWLKRKVNQSNIMLSIGFFAFALGSFIGIIFSEFGSNDSVVPLNSTYILPLTSVILTLFLIGSYFISIIDYLYEKGEYDSLAKLAYVDFLTNLANRTTAVKYMQDLDEKHKVYSVISIDVNNLKIVNDTQGHLQGDQLLVNLSFLLKARFSKYGCVARMGGDEFLVILKDYNLDKTKEILEIFDDDLKKFNDRKDASYTISISYGYASTQENKDYTGHDVYIISDSRMYEMKEAYHKDFPRCQIHHE